MTIYIRVTHSKPMKVYIYSYHRYIHISCEDTGHFIGTIFGVVDIVSPKVSFALVISFLQKIISLVWTIIHAK